MRFNPIKNISKLPRLKSLKYDTVIIVTNLPMLEYLENLVLDELLNMLTLPNLHAIQCNNQLWRKIKHFGLERIRTDQSKSKSITIPVMKTSFKFKLKKPQI